VSVFLTEKYGNSEKYFKTKFRPVGIFPFCSATAQLGPRLPRFEVSRSLSQVRARVHTHTHTHTHVHISRTQMNGLSAHHRGCHLHNKYKRWIFMPSAGFKPVIPEIEQLQTYALDCSATGIGL